MTAIRLTGDLRLADRCLVAGLDLPLAANRWTVLLGASGLGKTSLARLIAGLPTPAQIDGLTPPNPHSVGLMSQDSQLLPWATALDNVVIAARLAGQRPDIARAKHLLTRVGLTGLETRKPGALSAGQRQRVALARVLYDDRAVIILDEPFSALDVLTRQRMQDLAAELLTNRTVLLITHDPAEAVRMAEHAFILQPDGVHPVDLPPGHIPRAADATETLAAQASLLTRLAMSSPSQKAAE